MVDYYSQRATAGLVLTEATSISEAAHGWRNAPLICTPEHAQGWKKVVNCVHEKDSVIFLQLWHLGRQAHSSFHPSTNKTFSASDIPMAGHVKTIEGVNVDGEVPSPMTVEEIKQTVQDYVAAAQLCKEAGFDGVEIHAANGYLLDQFLQSSSNVRTDEYGGSVENRARFLLEVFDAIVESGSYPADRIGFRISPNGAFGGMGSEDNHEAFIEVARLMNTRKPAYLHIMDGLGFGYHEKSPVVTTMDMKKVFDGPIIANVGLTKDMAEGMIRSGTTDLCAFGRLYLSNPDLPQRFEKDLPLAEEPGHETWFAYDGAKGYSDYPTAQ